ncbi:MAG TPA: OmpA family protein [Stellaceae bacterium]|jgi:outer membrane protein OmpA-like peptidoglycan-associated protein
MLLGRALALGMALSALGAAGGYAQVVGSDEPYTGPNGPYLRAEGGWSHLNDMKGQGASGLNFGSKEDDGFMAGGAAGWKFGQLRVELGLDFSGYDVDSIRVNGDGGLGTRLHTLSLTGATTSPSGRVHVLDGMVNALWDFRTGTPFVPYIGIGVGMASVSLDSFSVGGRPLSDSNDVVFAYQPMVGVRYHVTDAIAIGAEYRYFATVDPTFKDSTGVKFTGRIESHNVLANLSVFFGAPPAPPQPAVAPAPVPAAPMPINPSAGPAPAQAFVVYFDTGHATLTPAGRRVADDAVAAFQRDKAAHIALAGYTDTVGNPRSNEALSRRRAETVRDYLVAHGVPMSEMMVNWHGEANPQVPTGNGVPEAQNRRVVINIP